jgi:hypothetical protein
MDGWMPVMSYYNSVLDEIHPPSTGWMLVHSGPKASSPLSYHPQPNSYQKLSKFYTSENNNNNNK